MTTISSYLLTRMHQAGVGHAFGVPGDYVLDFMDRVVESPIELICTCNELNAGYAADAYGRLGGIGAAVVTYGVGGLSILNAVAGAFAERVPLVLVSGAPHSKMRHRGMLMHHLAGDYHMQLDIFRNVTAAAVMLTDARTAPEQIDRAIAACINEKRPVYIEIPVDLVDQHCTDPDDGPLAVAPTSDSSALCEAVAEAAELLAEADNPAVLVGLEVRRFSLAQQVTDLLEKTGWPFATTINSKTAVTESHPHYLGVYQGGFSHGPAHDTIEQADCLLTLGAWMTDITTGGFTAHLDDSRMIAVNSDKVRIRHHYYDQVALGDFVVALTSALQGVPSDLHAHSPTPYQRPAEFTPAKDAALTVRRFFEALNHWLDDDMIVISDIGDVIFGATELYRPQTETFIAQGYYMSIGYSLPAALGACFARPDRRAIVFVGDGAFQMTPQAISTLMRYGKAPIVVVLNNDGYVIERMIHDGPYNELQMWRYSALAEAFQTDGAAAEGRLVKTEAELAAALKTAADTTDRLVVIEAQVQRTDCTEILARVGQHLRDLAAEH
ncbi:hypothetical protein LCGC14_0276610 [marine sediment metagenome]|uniref:Pyruvate decarboxylase n=1 Tax=marine sediment metagenome TaxID=412755 RepID=A0A0F9UE71_9ZZZZ|nr:alpha-keto acid decarboxylase family protein [Phycisphaerae bacterium]